MFFMASPDIVPVAYVEILAQSQHRDDGRRRGAVARAEGDIYADIFQHPGNAKK
jgi:hypothetical protein